MSLVVCYTAWQHGASHLSGTLKYDNEHNSLLSSVPAGAMPQPARRKWPRRWPSSGCVPSGMASSGCSLTMHRPSQVCSAAATVSQSHHAVSEIGTPGCREPVSGC